MHINSDIAELCGIILGDGHLHSTENRIVITGSNDDLFYYKNHLILLFKKHFGVTPKLVRIKNKNSYRLILENKRVFDFFIDIGLVRGKKDKITIPKTILNDSSLLKSFIKGLFDTDGYLKFSKQNKNINYYPRIRFSFYNTPLPLELGKVFKELGFNFGFCVDKRNDILCYEISGFRNLREWMKSVGSSNDVHLSKYLLWEKFGHVPIKLSLRERQKMLKEKIYKNRLSNNS